MTTPHEPDPRPAPHDPEAFDPLPGRCNARKTDGSGLCRNGAGKGTGHAGFGQCYKHGGRTPSSHKHAAGLAVRQRVADLIAEYEVADDVDPLEALLEVLGRARAMWLALGQLVGELDAGSSRTFVFDAQSGGYEPNDRAGLYGPNHLGDGAPHVLLAEYGVWTDRLARVSKLALDAGIDERRVRIVESQAEQLADVVRAVAAGVIADFLEVGADRAHASEVQQRLGATVRRAIEQTGVIDAVALEG